MRILHTSDWHLGIHHGPTSRGPDQDAFLTWLLSQLRDQKIDLLVIAGDIFDSIQPSADALNRYYRFLAQLGSTGVAQVIIVGGNHDSASRLDAPSEVLEALNIRVIGGLQHYRDDPERYVIPLHSRGSDEVQAVALAVPYVHEFRLGVRTTDPDQAVVRAEFLKQFSDLYTTLTEVAIRRYPGLPILATGHLTLGKVTRDDYPLEIHQVGTLDTLPASLLDPRIQYTALGHIHRYAEVGSNGRAFYCGTPVAYSLRESKSPRRVLIVELHPDPAGEPVVTPVEVPCPRQLVELRGSADELVEAIRALSWKESLPPLVFGQVVTDVLPPELRRQLFEASQQHPSTNKPILAELRHERLTAPEAHAPTQRPLQELQPREVFEELCLRQQVQDVDALKQAFDTLAMANADDFEAMIANIDLSKDSYLSKES